MSTFADRIDARRGVEIGEGSRAADTPSTPTADALESVSPRMVCVMRFVLALSALIITLLDPSEPNRLVTLTCVALLLYTMYSGILYLVVARTGENPSSPASTWIDVGSYVVFIAASSGAGSIFFFFFFFAIMVASFRNGLKSGLRVTLVSAALFTVVGYAASAQNEFEMNRFLMRTTCLLVLGYMIAVWGDSEHKLKRRLELLRSIGRSANPRFGIDQTMCVFMEGVRKFYQADTCLLVTQNPETHEYFLRRADRLKSDRAVGNEMVSGEIGCQLAWLLGEEAVAYEPRRSSGRRGRVLVAGRAPADADDPRLLPAALSLRHLVGDEAFLSAPLRRRDGTAARLYVTSRERPFDGGDLQFLCQVVEHATPHIENHELLDQLASMAANQERRRISSDLHDSTIQPYIGLKMGLEAVRRKAAPDNPLNGDLSELLMRIEVELADLRRYVRGLKREDHEAAEPVLTAAVRQYAEQFARLSGLDVSCEVQSGLGVSDRLAAEAFQIVREGLSNVRRHTAARRAAVRLSSAGGRLVIEVENEAPGASFRAVPFTPRSIKGRAELLGGMVRVGEGERGVTVVRVEIPR
ncbi:MAG TPA: histidine kinase [Pyrinomonadaceae bacterium]